MKSSNLTPLVQYTSKQLSKLQQMVGVSRSQIQQFQIKPHFNALIPAIKMSSVCPVVIFIPARFIGSTIPAPAD